jgi:hypothetical protein
VVGLVIAFGAIRGLIALAPMDALRTNAIHIDGTVLLYTLAIALGTGLLFGLAPAIQASRADLQHALKDGARTSALSKRKGARHISSALVVGQLALTLVLLVGACLLLRSFARLRSARVRSDAPGHDDVSLRCEVRTGRPGGLFLSGAPEDRSPPGPSRGRHDEHPFGGNWSTGSFRGRLPAAERATGTMGRSTTVTGVLGLKLPLLKGRTISEATAPKPARGRRGWEAARASARRRTIGKRITFDDPRSPAWNG